MNEINVRVRPRERRNRSLGLTPGNIFCESLCVQHCMKMQRNRHGRIGMAIDLDKRNALVRKSVGVLGAAVRSGMVTIGEKLGLHKALAASLRELRRGRTTSLVVARCTWTRGDTRTSGNAVTAWRNRHETFVRRRRVIAAAVLSCVLLVPSRSYSEGTPNQDDRVVTELSTLGKQGDTIARARGQVLEILQNENACTSWFQEADPAPAEVFQSLHFELEMSGPSYIYGMRDTVRGQVLKHPWAASSTEYAGRNSTIRLNAHGPFFNRTSIIVQLNPRGLAPRLAGNRPLVISSYPGNTPEAQITILLHELGHIIGRLPEDSDSWDGRSSENTSNVLRHCKIEVRAAAHNSPTSSIRAAVSGV
jgi:hypothetical protein